MTDRREPARPGLARLLELHASVDRRAARLAARHRDRLQCRRGCTDCCIDGLTVLEVEAVRIRCGAPELLRHGIPHPPGACAFLDAEGACRIYRDRPFVCRTQGLPLRWFEETGAGDVVERRDVCPLNLPHGPPLAALGEEELWTLGVVEQELAALQAELSGEPLRRTPLRELFERPS